MNGPASFKVFSLLYGPVYMTLFWINEFYKLAWFRYYPALGRFSTELLPAGTAGQFIVWYFWLFGAAVVSLALSLVSLPPAGQAQQAASVPRIGFLFSTSQSDPRVPRFLQAFRQGLREVGYVEGQNIAIEFRWADGQYDRLPGLAAELVRLKVNVIVAGVPVAIQAAKQATETIPIVITGAADPVAAGFVTSLARPGGNITGISYMAPDLVGKQLQLLKEVLPKLSKVALLGNPANPSHTPWLRAA